MPEPRIIKRYANRKLYDTQTSHYVTLEQIAEMIRNGEEIRVLDNTTKEDLTSVTLAQIIFEEEKRKSFLPLHAMRNIIQSGGASLSELAQHAQARVTSLFRKSEAEAAREEGAPPAGEPPEPEPRREEGGHHTVRELYERSQHAIDELQRRVDERLRHLLETISPFAGLEKEVVRLRERVEALEKEVEALRNRRPRTNELPP
jgi:polyhydroxyalkanoate synthesis repressor PhaR